MKSLKIKLPLILMLFFLFLLSSYGYAREIKTTKGTEFIVAFQPNIENLGLVGSLELFLSSELGSEGVVEIPKLGVMIPFSVGPGESETIAISPLMSKSLGERIDNYAIRVTSNNPISLYGINHKHESTDAFLAIPVPSLGKSYIVMSYAPFYAARSMVIATQDNTEIKLTSPNGGVKRTIILNRMQTYHFSLSPSVDQTGTRIEASAPVAVFGGVDCANVPKGIGYCDHLVEMMMPVETWGNSFVTYPLATRLKGDLIRVLAAFDNTEVRINGQLVKVLAKTQYHDLISTEPLEIVTSLPVSVAQYSLGQQYDGVISDPFMMLIPPVEQLLNEYTFTTPEAGSSLYFVNVVARTTSLADLRLDGQPINQSLFNPIGNGRYSAAQIPLVVGAHHIKGSNTFGIYVYGYGNYDSYGYPGGMGTEIINSIDSDYRNVSVVSTLAANGIELDVGSFTVAPKSIEEVDGHINIEWFFPGFSIGQIKNLDYEVVAKNLLPGEKRTITNSLELRYQDINGVEHKRSLGQQNLDVLASGFALNISTDKAIYGPEQTVEISTQVANADSAQAVITLEMRILDKDGNFVANVATPPTFILAAKETIQLSPQQFFTGTTYVGDYQVHAILKDNSGLVVAESTASFEVAAADTVQMSAQVHTDKLVYQVKDNLGIESRFSNLSTNSMLEDVTVSTRVLDENGNVYWAQSSSLAQLTPGAANSIQFTVPLVDASIANYTVQVTAVNTDGVVLASDQINFTIRDNPLFALTGSVSVEKAELQLGEQPSCTYVVNNVSTKSIHEQAVRLNLVRVDEELVIKSEDKSVTLPAQTTQSFTPELSVASHIGNYACVLEAGVAGELTTLASALFTVKESPIKLTGDIALGEKSRLLVLMDDSATEKPYLESLLANAGWFYTIVNNANDFEVQLDAGGYGAYALLSENITLKPQTRDALKAKVALGDGLFVASGHDRRHQSLEDALGVRVHAKQAHIKGVTVDASVLGDAWSHTFDETFNSMTFDAQGATVVGRYGFSSSQNNSPQQSLGAASSFNVFVLENFTSLSSTVEGRIAVGGNLSLQNFSVGDKLDPSKLHDVALVGGNVTFPSGRVYYGNLLAGGSVAGVGDAVRYGMAPGAVIRGSTTLPVDFASERDYLQTMSTDLAALPANGKVKMKWGGMELTGDCSSAQQVFTVNASDLATAHTFAVSCIPSGATVIFNIPGQSATIQSIGMQSLSNLREKVLFNFPQAKTLTFKSVAIEGSVLAPYAVVEQPAGRVEGQVVVKSWNSTNWGYMSIHNRTFKGDLSAVTKPKSTNALAIYQYQQGKTVFASFDVLAQALVLHNKPVASDNNVFAQLLLAALNQVNPEPSVARAGKVVPVVVALENIGGQAANGQALLVLSGSLEMVQSAEFIAVPETTTWSVPFSLPTGGQITKTVYVRMPASGSANIQFQLQTGVGPDVVTRFEKSLMLNVQ